MMRWTRKHIQFDTGNFNDANGGKNKQVELDPSTYSLILLSCF